MNTLNSKKFIPGYDGIYQADINGNIFKGDHKMTPSDNGIGYLKIKLTNNGIRSNLYLHRVIWETFNGPIQDGYEINHIDHNKYNNKLSNLELITHSENIHKARLEYGYFGSMNTPLDYVE